MHRTAAREKMRMLHVNKYISLANWLHNHAKFADKRNREEVKQKVLRTVPEYKNSIENNSIQPSSSQDLFLCTLEGFHDPAGRRDKPLQDKSPPEPFILLGDPAAKVHPDIGGLLPEDRVERQEEHAEADVDARGGQKRADFHLPV